MLVCACVSQFSVLILFQAKSSHFPSYFYCFKMETLWDSEGPGSDAIGIPRKGIKSAGESLLSGVLVMCACVVRADTRNGARGAQC